MLSTCESLCKDVWIQANRILKMMSLKPYARKIILTSVKKVVIKIKVKLGTNSLSTTSIEHFLQGNWVKLTTLKLYQISTMQMTAKIASKGCKLPITGRYAR